MQIVRIKSLIKEDYIYLIILDYNLCIKFKNILISNNNQ